MRIIKKYDQYIKENKKVNEDIEDEFSSDENEIENEDPLDDGDDMDFPENEFPGDNENELEKDDVGVGSGRAEIPAEKYSDDPATPEAQHEDEGEEEEGHQYIGSKMLGELADKLGAEVSNNSIMYNGKKINFYSETEKFHVDRKKFKTADEVVEYLSSDQPDVHSQEEVSKSRGPEFDDDDDDDDDDFEPEFKEEENQLDNEIEEEELEEPIMQENLKHRSYRQTRTFESFRKK